MLKYCTSAHHMLYKWILSGIAELQLWQPCSAWLDSPNLACAQLPFTAAGWHIPHRR